MTKSRMTSEIELTLKHLSEVCDDCADCYIAYSGCTDTFKRNVFMEIYRKKCEIRKQYADRLYELTKSWEN